MINKIYLAYGTTDFRKQTSSLCNMIKNTYNMNPYDRSAYIFCNKKRTSIKVLCYDKNGFILAQKTLVDTEKMKFQWPRNSTELKNISKQQFDCNEKLKIMRSWKEKYCKINIFHKFNFALIFLMWYNRIMPYNGKFLEGGNLYVPKIKNNK